jgi:hypothetical protein
VESLKKDCSGIISLKKKTIRNSGKGKSLHIVSAWYQNNPIVLSQGEKCEKKQ